MKSGKPIRTVLPAGHPVNLSRGITGEALYDKVFINRHFVTYVLLSEDPADIMVAHADCR